MSAIFRMLQVNKQQSKNQTFFSFCKINATKFSTKNEIPHKITYHYMKSDGYIIVIIVDLCMISSTAWYNLNEIKLYMNHILLQMVVAEKVLLLLVISLTDDTWVTVTNDFFGHDWGNLYMTIIDNHLTSDQNVIHGDECIISFLTDYSCPEHAIPLKTIDCSFRIVAKDGLFWLSIVTSPQLICDVTRTWNISIATSYSSIALVRANWRNGDLN